MRKWFARTFIISITCCVAALLVIAFIFVSYRGNVTYYFAPTPKGHLFEVQSVDTMKYSRDMAAQILDNPGSFKSMIDKQMKLIEEVGATHVGIATPYDARFIPVLRLWVDSARAHNLSVWFRGNFSGWEEWFGYARINRVRHKQLLQDFLRSNPDLFESGDAFSPCPECENGGSGDPRQTNDVNGYNTFLIDEAKIAATEFTAQGKHINVYPSMNADIARDIISPLTVRAFGGTILIDHYVRTSEQFANDIEAIPKKLNADIGLGEFGAPIPDLNGSMTQTQQATYIDELFAAMYERHASIPVVNYWTLSRGSTAIVSDNGMPREAYFTVQNYFKAFNVYGIIYNSLGETVTGAQVSIINSDYFVAADETYQIFVPRKYEKVIIRADGYAPVTLTMPTDATTTVVNQNIYLEPINPNWWYKTRASLYTKLGLKIK